MLARDQIDHFKTFGFLVCRQVFSSEEVYHIIEEAEALGVTMFVGSGTRQAWAHALGKGEPSDDSTVIMQHYEKLAAIEWPED